MPKKLFMLLILVIVILLTFGISKKEVVKPTKKESIKEKIKSYRR